MFDTLRKIINGAKADYADIRYEIKKDTIVAFNGRELSQIGSNSTDGYVVRVLDKGGLASVAFTQLTDASKSVRFAAENAHLIGKARKEPVRFAPTEVIKDAFIPELKEDPRKVTMAEKLELTRKYNNIPLKYDKIVMANISYREICREKYFLNSEGTEIREDLITVQLSGLITSRDGNLIQNIRVGAGGSDGFSSIRNQEKLFEENTAVAIDLLKSSPVKGGMYNCILNPGITGVFAHEAFGHFSEADIIETLPAMREKMKIGGNFGSDVLNIADDAPMPGQLGFYKYDDEGVKVRRVQLIKNGVLTGRLHSRRTAAEFNEPLSGHSIAEDYNYAPIIRMGNIFIEPGSHSLEALLGMLGDGLYVVDAKGGSTSGENFSFGALYAYLVKNGKKTEMVRDINISGNLYQTLKDIKAVGNELVLRKTGGCGKGQLNLRSSLGGPNILVNNLVVGGI
ncbi:MAG: TldD/PmbA family protein [Planctomycetes bacterium]|nr:TldD/PmbA family protein [Planctomycetota bacterium]